MRVLLTTFACAALLAIVVARCSRRADAFRLRRRSTSPRRKAAAGTDHVGSVHAVCNGATALAKPPAPRRRRAGPRAGPRSGGPPPPPARETWHAEPVEGLRQLYFVGQTEYSAWAITTSQGIILLDAIYDYSVEDEVVEGLKKLGLNPADIKYVIVSHGHLDHAGGAKYPAGEVRRAR